MALAALIDVADDVLPLVVADVVFDDVDVSYVVDAVEAVFDVDVALVVDVLAELVGATALVVMLK